MTRSAALSRDDLLALGLEAFRTKGYEGTTLSDLLRATGLTKGGLYHHFPGGKEEIGGAVVDYVDRLFDDMVFAPLRGDGRPPARVAAMNAALDRYFASGSKVCLPALLGLSSTRDLFGAAVGRYFRHWVDALAEAFAAGGAEPEVARAAAARVVAAIQGGLVLSRALDDGAPFQDALSAAVEEAVRLDRATD